jgi:hypothetical protein
VSIMLSHLPPNSKQWTKAMNISHRSKYSNQNPVLFYDDAASPHGLRVHSQQPGGSTDESTATVWPLRVLCCAVLQHGGLRCNVSYCAAMWCTALYPGGVRCIALYCFVTCGTALQRFYSGEHNEPPKVVHRVALCCNTLRCAAACSAALQQHALLLCSSMLCCAATCSAVSQVWHLRATDASAAGYTWDAPYEIFSRHSCAATRPCTASPGHVSLEVQNRTDSDQISTQQRRTATLTTAAT